MVRLSGNSNSPKDLIALKKSLEVLEPIKKLLNTYSNEHVINLAKNLDQNRHLYELIDKSIETEAPLSPKNGDVIKIGYSEELDRRRREVSGEV